MVKYLILKILKHMKKLLSAVTVLLAVFSFGHSAFAADKTIGVLMTGNIPFYNEIHSAFIKSLKSEGLGPDKVEVLVQKPSPEYMSWVNAARKFVAIDVDVVVSYGAPITLAILDESSSIPVVFAGVYGPKSIGIRGENITGISSTVPVAGLIKNLKKISNFSTLGVTYNSDEKDTILQSEEVNKIAAELNFKAVKLDIKKDEDVSKITGVDALFLSSSCSALHCLAAIDDFAMKEKVPTASIMSGGKKSRIILIIKGAKPSSLKIKRPKKIEMIINMKEASAMGLKVPFDLLTLATKVIK
jgi:putative ABC transport system substrate-binding protein